MPRGQWDRTLTKEQRLALKERIKGEKVGRTPAIKASPVVKVARTKAAKADLSKKVTGGVQHVVSKFTRDDLTLIQGWAGTISSLIIGNGGYANANTPREFQDELLAAIQTGARIRESLFPVPSVETQEEEAEEPVQEAPVAAPAPVAAAPAPAPAVVAPAPAPAPVGYAQ